MTAKHQPTVELLAAAREELRRMQMPKRVRDLYPALHAVASAVSDRYGPYSYERHSKAIGAVFFVACQLTGATYQSQYMSNVLDARFKDGSMEKAFRA